MRVGEQACRTDDDAQRHDVERRRLGWRRGVIPEIGVEERHANAGADVDGRRHLAVREDLQRDDAQLRLVVSGALRIEQLVLDAPEAACVDDDTCLPVPPRHDDFGVVRTRVHLLDENMQPFDSKELGGLLSILLSIHVDGWLGAATGSACGLQSGAENRCVVWPRPLRRQALLRPYHRRDGRLGHELLPAIVCQQERIQRLDGKARIARSRLDRGEQRRKIRFVLARRSASRRRIAPILRVTSGKSLAAFAKLVSEASRVRPASTSSGIFARSSFSGTCRFSARLMHMISAESSKPWNGPGPLNSSSHPHQSCSLAADAACGRPTSSAATTRAKTTRRRRSVSIRTTISSVSPIAISERRRC